MASRITVLLTFLLWTRCLSAFVSQAPRQEQRSIRLTREAIDFQFRPSSSFSFPSDDPECDPCANFLGVEDEDLELDRREAFFSLLGMAWATASLPAAMFEWPMPAEAVYGADAKIELPNPIQGLNDRATKQCLVESLGTRECLVYMDEDNKLYQGADSKLLLDRVDKASQYLSQLPNLIENKKWSQVTGVLTGPMGELVRTMYQLVELSENKDLANPKINQVKNDLYAIAGAVNRKQGDEALKFHQAATDHLVAFVKAL